MANAADAGPLGDDELQALFGALDLPRGVILAVSGGSDSTALMYLFARWARATPNLSNSLVVTVDHGLRPEAAAEAEEVGCQARALGFRHATLRWTGEKPQGDLQNAARTARYGLLTDAARAEGVDAILTAHTLDDQAETFLLALARGSGVYGLGGMPVERAIHGIRILRPLLPIAKARLTATLVAAGFAWIEDPSNRNDRFRRVVMRQAQPALDDLGLTIPVLANTAARLSRAAAALDTYADRLITASMIVHAGGYIEVDLEPLIREPEEVGLRSLARVLKAVRGATYVPRLDRLERLLQELSIAHAAGTRLHRTLGGVTAHLPAMTESRRPPRLWLFAEEGRAGFGVHMLSPGQTLDWDDRIRITLSTAASLPLRIRALGPIARRLLGRSAPDRVPSGALGTLASAWREDDLVAVLGLSPQGEPAAEPYLTATGLIAERLTGKGPQATRGS